MTEPTLIMPHTIGIMVGVPMAGEPADTHQLSAMNVKHIYVLTSAIAWFEDVPEVMGTLLHLTTGETFQTMPVHGDADEFAARLNRGWPV